MSADQSRASQLNPAVVVNRATLQGWTTKEIADYYGVSTSEVRRILRAWKKNKK